MAKDLIIPDFNDFGFFNKLMKSFNVNSLFDALNAYSDEVRNGGFLETKDNTYELKLPLGTEKVEAKNISIVANTGERKIEISYKSTDISNNEEEDSKNKWNKIASYSYNGVYELPIDADIKSMTAKVINNNIVITAKKIEKPVRDRSENDIDIMIK